VKPLSRPVPCTVKRAIKWVAEHHRHLPKMNGGRFAVGLEHRGVFVGCGVVGNGPRVWEGSTRMVITRVAVLASYFDGAMALQPWEAEGSSHASGYCSQIYGALCRAGKTLGYTEAWTYTLWWEPGSSLRGAGFWNLGLTDGGEWSRESRPRAPAVQPDPKRRWVRPLTDEAKAKIAAPYVAAIVAFARHFSATELRRAA
jgi:hypothetical protein